MANSSCPYSMGWPLAIEFLDHFAGDITFDFVHQLHGFDDAQDLAHFHLIADLDERRCTGRRRFVERSDNRRTHDVENFSRAAGAAPEAERADAGICTLQTGARRMHREVARVGRGAVGSAARLILTLTSPRSSSNSAISFSIKNSMSSFSSF